jgi:acetyltransferase-like isoleucine patch superfamily enzyme
MTVRDVIPEFLVAYVRTIQAKLHYPGATIWSDRIDPSASIGSSCLIAGGVEIGPNVTIASNSYVNKGTIIASGCIGKFCSIGYYCQIGMPEHPLDFASTSPRTYGRRNVFGAACTWDDYSRPPRIGSDVWVGSGAIILQGVEIGDGAIIAGGAVVTKSVAPYAIAAGVPARVLRKRFDDESIAELMRLQWWDLPLSELGAHARLFGTRNWHAVSSPNTEEEEEQHS